MTVIVLWLFLMVPWVGLQCVIVLFPDHTHFFCVHLKMFNVMNSYAGIVFKQPTEKLNLTLNCKKHQLNRTPLLYNFVPMLKPDTVLFGKHCSSSSACLIFTMFSTLLLSKIPIPGIMQGSLVEHCGSVRRALDRGWKGC